MAQLSENDQRQFEAALRGALRSAGSRPRGDCPASEILAAYCERAVTHAELERLDQHFATCERCRAQLAAIGRSEEGGAAQIGLAQVLPQARASRWRVLAPALAAVLALVVVATVLRSRDQVASRGEIAMLSKQEREAARPESADELKQKAVSLRPRDTENRRENTPSVIGGAASDVRRGGGDVGMSKDRDVAAPADVIGGAAPAERLVEGRLGEAAGAPSASVAASEARAEFRAKTLSRDRSSFGSMRADKLGDEPAVGNVEVRSADGAKEWIVGEGGLIALRESSGLRVLASGVGADLLAGSAPSSKVCWVVGRGSTILRTTDGEKWQRVAVPARADFVGVHAQSADRARVQARDGREFATVDGGVSWRSVSHR